MRAPVLVVADEDGARAIGAAVSRELEVTITDNSVRARALASTGAFLAVLVDSRVNDAIAGATIIDVASDPTSILETTRAAIHAFVLKQSEDALLDEVGAVPYDEYIELARYAMTRRYVLALLGRHHGSVTDAARGANMKRESLHRLMRRYHVSASDFRPR
jgi:DNA-binding NtrC family response regulator